MLILILTSGRRRAAFRRAVWRAAVASCAPCVSAWLVPGAAAWLVRDRSASAWHVAACARSVGAIAVAAAVLARGTGLRDVQC